MQADPSPAEFYAHDGYNPVGLSRSREDRVTVPEKTPRLAMARFLPLWGFYRPTPANAGTLHGHSRVSRGQRPSIAVSVLSVNCYGAHAPAHTRPRHPLPLVVSSTRVSKLTSEKLSRSDLVQYSVIRLGAVKHGTIPYKDRLCPYSTILRRTKRWTAS